MIYLGYGVLGGIGLGIGYISPVSTLIKWFPDRPGMATGMAIMGFGGGAFIASPLSVWLMSKFTTPTHVGVAETFIVLGVVYFVFMMVGSIIVRVPAPGWAPAGYVAPTEIEGLITRNDVFVYDALKTPQFWLIWWVLCLNVTAGIGVLGQASAMSQEMFPGHITPVAAAGFVGLMSLFNMGGRFVWASTSDYIGRRNTYFVFMVLGFILYCTVPYTGSIGSVVAVRLLLPRHHQHVWRRLCHRAGLSAGHVRHAVCRRHPRPAADRLVDGGHLRAGARQLHPRVQHHHGVPKAQAYNTTMYIMAGLLVIGFICNFFVKAVNARFHMKANDPRAHDALGAAPAGAGIREKPTWQRKISKAPRPSSLRWRGASSASRLSLACCRRWSTR